MTEIVAIYGSPRRKGNTAALLQAAVEGARQAGARVEEVVLRDLKMSPCLEIYGCKKTGRCVIEDDFHPLVEKVAAAGGLMLASPVFFYTVSAHTKIFMDRCQSLWVKKYWIDKTPPRPQAGDPERAVYRCRRHPGQKALRRDPAHRPILFRRF